MKLFHASIIATGMVIFFGAFMVLPPFLPHEPPKLVLLSFSIVDENAVPWCHQLSDLLKKHRIEATVFFSGKIAEENPDCVKSLPNNVDIGSQTYSYVSLSSIEDYTLQLEEVKKGKQAVDKAGNLNSRLFKAPYGSTDDNIYSLLSRSNILADFSYEKQYNKFHEEKFLKFDLESYNGKSFSTDSFESDSDNPILISFDNTESIDYIDNFIYKIKENKIRFIDASKLTGIPLTVRNGEQV